MAVFSNFLVIINCQSPAFFRHRNKQKEQSFQRNGLMSDLPRQEKNWKDGPLSQKGKDIKMQIKLIIIKIIYIFSFKNITILMISHDFWVSGFIMVYAG